MRYTNKELYTYFEILNTVAEKVTGKLAYLVTKNARRISNELQEYIDIRNQKIKDYGTEENGRLCLAVDSLEYSRFVAEMVEYDGIELEIDILKAAPADLYTSVLNAVEMDMLSFMIEDEDA